MENENLIPEEEEASILTLTDANGEAYYGEMKDGLRHGYGVYYWSNGDFWYGRYENGYRQGYGALFKTDHRVFWGKWVGDSKVQ